MACNCKNGRTDVISLTSVTSGAATYVLELTHYTCGNRKLCTQEMVPVSANINFKVLGAPVSVGNAAYCCEVLVTGTVTYMPYIYGCQCNVCPRTDNIYTTICVPCSSAEVPTITAGEAVAVPTGAQPCCNVTNAIAITTSLNVATA